MKLAALCVTLGTTLLSGCTSEADVPRDVPFAQGSKAFKVITSTGEEWLGDQAQLRIIEALPNGRPAVAEVSFAAVSSSGGAMAIYAVLEPGQLLAGDWTVDLDGSHATTSGYGLLSYVAGAQQATAPSGSLRAATVLGTLSGDFTADLVELPALSSATFEGAFALDCLLARSSGAPRNGDSVGAGPGDGGFALESDIELSSAFCAPFAGLRA